MGAYDKIETRVRARSEIANYGVMFLGPKPNLTFPDACIIFVSRACFLLVLLQMVKKLTLASCRSFDCIPEFIRNSWFASWL